jgi:hypothetical protein
MLVCNIETICLCVFCYGQIYKAERSKSQNDGGMLCCGWKQLKHEMRFVQTVSFHFLQEIAKFFYHLWPKFVSLCEKNKSMFVEILFWKTAREAQEIQDGYVSHNNKPTVSKKGSRLSWTDDEESELALLAEEHAALPDEGKLKMWLFANLRLS